MNEKIAKNLRVALPAFLAFWFLSSAGELIQLYQKHELLVLNTDGRQMLADFNAFYNAGLLCRDYFAHGQPFYDIPTQLASLAKVIAPDKSDVVMLSVNPPHFFLLCLPLTYLSVYHAWLLWAILNLLCLAAGLLLIDLKQLPDKYERVCAVIGCLATSTTFTAIRHGQNSFMLLLCHLAFWRLLEAKKFFLAGLSLALCMFKPQYLPVLCTAGLIVGGVRFALGGLVAGLAIVGISVAAFGPDIFPSWWHFIASGEHPDFAYMMQNIRGELTICMHGRDDDVGAMTAGIILFVGISLVAWLWLLLRKRWQDPVTFRFLVAMTISVMLFSSPHTQGNDYVLFYITCIWTWLYLGHMKRNWPKSILQVLITAYPYLSWVFLVLTPLFLVARIQPYLAWNLAIFVCSGLLIRVERTKSTA